MNIKKNQGYQKTHQNIKNCFLEFIEKKEVSHITIREICEAVSINRSTFYAHFQDIYAVMEEINEQLNEELLASYSAQDTSKLFTDYYYMLPWLEHLKKHPSFYLALLRSTDNLALRYSMDRLQADLIQPLLEKYQVDSAAGSYYFNFMKAGFLTIIRQWLEHGCPEPPEKLAKLILNLSPLYHKILSETFSESEESRIE